MQSVYLLSGSAVFPEDPKLTGESKIRLILKDITTEKLGAIKIAEKEVDSDANDLAIFKYLTFDFGDFDMEEERKHVLSMHVDKNGNGKVEEGDYITTDVYPVVTGLEEFTLQLEKV